MAIAIETQTRIHDWLCQERMSMTCQCDVDAVSMASGERIGKDFSPPLRRTPWQPKPGNNGAQGPLIMMAKGGVLRCVVVRPQGREHECTLVIPTGRAHAMSWGGASQAHAMGQCH